MSTTIPEYIAQLHASQQEKAQHIYAFLKTLMPAEVTETISYQMPTFRLNGVLLHFGVFKNHWSLFPGPSTLVHFEAALTSYKTTKSALQIPLEYPLPKTLLQEIVSYAITVQQNKKSLPWENRYEQWNEMDAKMSTLLQKTSLKKTFKWGTDVYTYLGINIVAWRGFKHFFSVWFYQGVFLKDPLGVLVSASEGKTKALRQWRFESGQNVDYDAIAAYIQESLERVDQGKTLTHQKAEEQSPEGLLLEALQKDQALHQAFYELSVSKRNEYVLYVKEAKQLTTQHRRVQKSIPLILSKKGLNDVYKK